MQFSHFRRLVSFVGFLALTATAALAEDSFKSVVGPVTVGPVKAGGVIEVPYITWGGDVATFHANGGLKTKQGSLFQKQGLNLNLVAGDNFVEQVRRYMAGKTPLLRGEMQMIGLASEVIGSDPKTKPVVFLQLTWSQGDHMVGREQVTLNTLKGKKVALQRNGPHVGLLNEILQTAKLTWDDITVVWADDLSGEKGPAEFFRKDPTIDACMVISPDMSGLTGGLEEKGSGAEGTVKNAHVVVSTAQLNRSIADVYACRKDFYDANRDWIDKFVAGYLKGCEEVTAMKQEYAKAGKSSGYAAVLKLTQQIYGEVVPSDADADGLISDCQFVFLPGNVSFFKEKNNLVGFAKKQQAVLDLAVERGYAGVRAGFIAPDLDYDKLATLGKLSLVAKAGDSGHFRAEGIEEFVDQELDERTIYSFTIQFKPEQDTFDLDVYGPEFQRAVEAAARFRGAVIAIRGHADPTLTLVNLVKAGMASGRIKRSGSKGNYQYFLDGKPLDLTRTGEVVKLIQDGAFAGNADANPLVTMQAALNLSLDRAREVQKALLAFAAQQHYTLDESQIPPVGVGIREPLIPKPANPGEAEKNMRVEFRILRVPAEMVQEQEYDF